MILALKIDVDTLRGTREGVPNLVELLRRHGVGATFLFSVGPDHTGRAIRRVFRPGFMQPYLDSFKLAGFIGIIADKTGRVHYKNVSGYADVEAKKPISEENVFWIASMTKMFAGASIMCRKSA